AANSGHEFQAVLDRVELANRRADLFRLTAHQRRRTDGRENIFDVVRSLERHFGNRHDLAHILATKGNPPVLYECSPLQLPLAAEPESLRARATGEVDASRIIGIQNRKVILLLILEDVGFGVDIGLESPVAIQMVGSNVQHDGNFRTKAADGLELKTRDLEH